jgi:hypothetical protein
MVRAGQQEALQSHHARLRAQPVVHRAVITEADKKRVEREKVDRFISGAQCRRIDLDQEMDSRVDRLRCEDGKERCDVCQESDNMMEEAEALRQAYIVEQERGSEHEPESGPESGPENEPEKEPANERYRPEPTLDSAIDIPSSQSVVQPSSLGVSQPSSPPVIQSDSRNEPSKNPISHMVSSDPGLEAKVTVIAEEADFQNQLIQYKETQTYARTQAQKECQAVWELEQQLEEWVGQCPVCFIRGFPDSKHSIINCVEDRAKEVKEDWI